MTEEVRCCGNCIHFVNGGKNCATRNPTTVSVYTFKPACNLHEHRWEPKVEPTPEPKFKLGQKVRRSGDNRVWTIQRLLNSHLGAAIQSYELQCISGFNPNIYFTAYAHENELAETMPHESLKGLEDVETIEQKFDQRLAKLEQELVENNRTDSIIAQRLSTLEQAVLKLVGQKE